MDLQGVREGVQPYPWYSHCWYFCNCRMWKWLMLYLLLITLLTLPTIIYYAFPEVQQSEVHGEIRNEIPQEMNYAYALNNATRKNNNDTLEVSCMRSYGEQEFGVKAVVPSGIYEFGFIVNDTLPGLVVRCDMKWINNKDELAYDEYDGYVVWNITMLPTLYLYRCLYYCEVPFVGNITYLRNKDRYHQYVKTLLVAKRRPF